MDELSPLFQDIEFRERLRGYDVEEVDAYIDRIAATLSPERGQILALEGHSQDAGERFAHDDHWLAFMRAMAVREYLIEVHEFPAHRVEARAWFTEIQDDPATRSVDARLITPGKDD